MKILVIAAHPDDEVLGMGGTINKYVKDGHKVKIVSHVHLRIQRHRLWQVADAFARFADVAIVSRQPELEPDRFYPEDRYVITAHTRQLAWLFRGFEIGRAHV